MAHVTDPLYQRKAFILSPALNPRGGFAAFHAVDGVDGQVPGSASVPVMRGFGGFGSLFDTIKSYLGTDLGKLLLLAAAAGGLFLAERRGWLKSYE